MSISPVQVGSLLFMASEEKMRLSSELEALGKKCRDLEAEVLLLKSKLKRKEREVVQANRHQDQLERILNKLAKGEVRA